jgi:hypothetical protein
MLNLPRFRNTVLLAVTIAVALQLVIFFSINNLIASALLLCGAFLGFYYAVNRRLLDEYPLSTLAIIGYTTYHFAIPPFGKLANFQGILTYLNHPILVWVYGLIGLFALVGAHFVYRTLSFYSIIRWSITKGFYCPLHFFEMPDQFQFWIMGIIGMIATLGIAWLLPARNESAVRSAARVLSPLVYMPYFVAYPALVDPRYRLRRRRVRLGLIAYTILFLAVSAMTNSRLFVVVGFASLVFVYGYRVLTGTISPPRLTVRSFIIMMIGVVLIAGPATNLAASMLIARKFRGTVSSPELAKETWRIYRSGTAVKAYEAWNNRALYTSAYKENYYNNILFNRLGNIRFTDLSIDAAQAVMTFGEASYFRRIEFDKIMAILPAPVIRILHLEIDKKKADAGSSEDFLYLLATGAPVGGFKTGEPMVILYMTFGMTWPIYFGLISTFMFTFFDASTDVGSMWAGDDRRFDCVVFNPIVAGTLIGYAFYPAMAQDVPSYVYLCTRGWVEMGLFYAVVFVLTKFMSSSIFGWVGRAEHTSQHTA